jgi:hypothetical protein
MKRKRRSDRNHIIYRIDNLQTGEFYIGVTQCIGRAYLASVKKRWKQHISRSKHQNLTWNLYLSIDEYGIDAFRPSILEIVRGKTEAHTRETKLIHELKPTLNSTHKI